LFVLDTDVVSNLRKAKQHPQLRAWIERTDPSGIGTTVVTITEIQCGIERQRMSDVARAHGTQAWLNGADRRLLQAAGPLQPVHRDMGSSAGRRVT
jgi:predicted nucleic acid-binding protein